MKPVLNENSSHDKVLDMIIVGGGINGAGIAADAAGRGLSVGLFEAADFASATSSASSKLIHGGLRYLEHYEFRLVSEALAEREILLNKAPHIAKPMRFRLPHRPFLRPELMIRAGLFLYDTLGKRTTLPRSKKIKLNAGNVTKSNMTTGFEYSDCWVDDARLVILNAMQAQEYGAEVQNYTQVVSAKRIDNYWQVELLNTKTQQTFTRQAKTLVNATGPWVKSFIDESLQQKSPYGIRLIKGSHIIVPKIHDEPQAYILQNEDKRIVFVIPYLDDYSMIGTTDIEYKGDPRNVAISPEEVDYLINIVNDHFVTPITRNDVISSFSGVRPLCDDESDSPQAITRDYTISLQTNESSQNEQAPLLSIFGGKLTTYRKLAESAMLQLMPFLPHATSPWTKDSALPGGEGYDFTQQLALLNQRFPDLPNSLLTRWLNTYGTYIQQMLKNIQTSSDLGQPLTSYLYQVEVDYLMEHEFAQTVDDILWRRTKLGLTCSAQEKEIISGYMAQQESKNVA